MTYNVNVVRPRRVSTVRGGRVDFGNVLRGATVSGNFVVRSGTDSDRTTMVYVAPGGTQLGPLTVEQTLVAEKGSVNVPVSGTLDTYMKGIFRGMLPVATAEAPEVQDATSYRSLSVWYQANVGLARFSRRPTEFGSGEMVLSADVAAGSRLTNLSSKVDPRGTLADDPTPAAWVTEPASLPRQRLYGAVGSEAEIVDSTEISADTTVTMQWRKRLRGEANYPHTPVSPTLPEGEGWLTSDVVKIGGIDSDVAFALQMSFDNRINLAFDGPIDGAVANEFPDLYIAEFDTTADQWVNAALLYTPGTYAHPEGVFESLADFLTDNAAVDLADLTGSWGVDPVTGVTGLGHSWTIISGGGSGIFAVDPGPSTIVYGSASSTHSPVPEPSTLVLLGIGAVSLLVCVRRRRRQAT